MFLAYIGGWNPIIAFAEQEETAKKKAVKEKKERFKDDLEKWTWETVSEYYGAFTQEVKDGTVIPL
jgi:hypothetical protein